MADDRRDDLNGLLSARRSDIIAAVKRHRGRRIRVFGSVARRTHSAASDVDFLVDFDSGSSLFDLMHLRVPSAA